MYKLAKFNTGKPVFIKNHEKEQNRAVLFKCTVPCGTDTVLHITAQNDYQLFINGSFIFAGPSRAAHGFYRVDRLNIEKHLTKKENTVCVLVNAYHCENFYLINQQAFLCAEFTDGSENAFGGTGSDFWSAYLYTQKIQRVQRYAFQRPFCEAYDFSAMMPYEIDEKNKQELVEYEINTFIEREVDYFDYDSESMQEYIHCGNVQKADTPRHFWAWWYDSIGKNYPGFKNDELEFSHTALMDSYALTKSERTPSALIQSYEYNTLKMRCNITGFVKIEVECNEDTTLLLSFDEVLTNGSVDYMRLECINLIAFKLSGKKSYTLITAEPYTFKYMNVISLGGAVKVNSLSVIKNAFPERNITKQLKPSADEQIKRIYDAALETFMQNTFDIYMDCPSRERAGWLCDSFFTSKVEHLMSSKSTVEKPFLSNFVMNPQYGKIPSGMLPMCYPADHVDGNYIPNWAMWYVIELKEYFNRTKDARFVNALKERMYALRDFFKTFENDDGLLSRLKGWIFVEWSECNNLCQDINYPTNMLYYAFKKTLAELYSDSDLLSEAKELKATVNARSRMGLFYCDNAIYDESGNDVLTGKCTETCQYYAFFTGITDIETDKELWETLVRDFGSDRKKNNKWPQIYFSNAFIGNYLRLDLLKQAGLDEILEKDIRGYFDYMALETGTLWENDTPKASCNHGFASHVLVWLDYLGYIESK